MNKLKNFLFLLVIPVLFVYTGCSSDDDATAPEVINEAEVLVKYLEENDYINTYAPSAIPTSDVYANELANENQIILDLRSQTDFETKGHVEGAVNVSLANVVTYYKENNLDEYDTVILTCYSGQTASYGTALLRLSGYNNVKVMLFGMSAWNPEVASSWQGKIGNGFATQLSTEETPKNAEGDLPTLSTGKTSGKDICDARIEALSAISFSDVTISAADVFGDPSKYYIVNYWPAADYATGHIPGAVQYTPKADLKLDAALKTLPTDKDIVVYCYTGTTSAQITAYLRLLGYDAYSLLFGTNGINHDTMPGKKFDSSTDAHDYPYVTGP